LRDHLGNTRVTFKDGNVDEKDPNGLQTYSSSQYDDGIVDASDIIQENHYYAFGLNMEGPWNGAAGDNKYQYNGKEWNDDFGLGWNDYGARFYDPAMARWVAVDPLAEKMTRYSPYNYCFDDPMRFVDPDGMAPEGWITNSSGGIYYDANLTSQQQVDATYGSGQYTYSETIKVTCNGVSQIGFGDGTSSYCLPEATVSTISTAKEARIKVEETISEVASVISDVAKCTAVLTSLVCPPLAAGLSTISTVAGIVSAASGGIAEIEKGNTSGGVAKMAVGMAAASVDALIGAKVGSAIEKQVVKKGLSEAATKAEINQIKEVAVQHATLPAAAAAKAADMKVDKNNAEKNKKQ
jgi:RHS repeat-associated protein